MDLEVSVLSPVHNEGDVVIELIEKVNKVMNSKVGEGLWEYILVNDSSTDQTRVMLEDVKSSYKQLRIFHHEVKGGQTKCFDTGFRHARGRYVITFDADMQLLPEDLPLFIDKMRLDYDIVNAIRENRQHPRWIKLASRLYNLLMFMFFQCPVFDAASNYMAIKTEYVKGLKLVDNDHRYLIPIAQRRGAKKIGEVIVQHKPRKKGKSKYKALPKYIKGFPEIFLAWIRINQGIYDK